MTSEPAPKTKTSHRPKKNIRENNVRCILLAAEEVFAETGFKGATTDAIAKRAGVPKANLHYYFSTKAELYQRVIEDVCGYWLASADTFDQTDDPATALCGYIRAKMDQARERPSGSKVWAMEVIRGAPVIDGYLEEVLKPWFEQRTSNIRNWIDQGKMQEVDPHALLFMIWATTQHYADFAHQMNVLNDGKPLSDQQYEQAKDQVCQIILGGIGLKL